RSMRTQIRYAGDAGTWRPCAPPPPSDSRYFNGTSSESGLFDLHVHAVAGVAARAADHDEVGPALGQPVGPARGVLAVGRAMQRLAGDRERAVVVAADGRAGLVELEHRVAVGRGEGDGHGLAGARLDRIEVALAAQHAPARRAAGRAGGEED